MSYKYKHVSRIEYLTASDSPFFVLTDLEELEVRLFGLASWEDDDFLISKLTGDFAFRLMPKLKDISVVLPSDPAYTDMFASGESQDERGLV